MKVHPFARGLWDHEPSLTLGCTKRLRPLAPKLADDGAADLKSFLRPDGGSKTEERRSGGGSPLLAAETHPGGTRWNPTQEQIGILEMLYRGGMRTPNAPQIEQITAQLGKYGKIEGKNVFYWFQNHKARERQKQKRTGLGSSPRAPSPPLPAAVRLDIRGGSGDLGREEDGASKRKCRGWGCPAAEDGGEEGGRTLELFPLHPECRIR